MAWRISSWSEALPGQHQERIGIPGDRHRDHHLGQVIAMILTLAPEPEGGADHVAVLIDEVLLLLIALEVGRGRIEEQQVDLEVEQIRGREVDRLGHLLVDLKQPVHRPIAGVLIELAQPGDPSALCDPLAASELRQRLERTVGDHREDHPLGAAVKPPAA